MKLMHFLPRVQLAEGGVVRAVLDVCAVLAQRGHEVTLLTTDPTDAPAEWKQGAPGAPKLSIIPPPTRPFGLMSKSAIQTCAPAVAECDVLHLHTPWETPNTQLAATARRAGTPYILSVHGMLDDWSMQQRTAKKRLYLALAGRKLLEQAARVHCTAEAELTQARKWFPRGAGVVIPLVFDLAPFEKLPGPALAREKFELLRAGHPALLFLSRVHPKKGVEHLIDAVAELNTRSIPVSAIIAGPGEESYVRELQARAEQLNVASRVDFVGLVSGREKLSLYEAAEVFVLPTSQENFGLVLPESLACRTPVVTTKGVDIWAELLESGAAEIVKADGNAIADVVQKLLASADDLRAMGERGREWVFKELSGERIVEQYESLYREVVNERAS